MASQVFMPHPFLSLPPDLNWPCSSQPILEALWAHEAWRWIGKTQKSRPLYRKDKDKENSVWWMSSKHGIGMVNWQQHYHVVNLGPFSFKSYRSNSESALFATWSNYCQLSYTCFTCSLQSVTMNKEHLLWVDSLDSHHTCAWMYVFVHRGVIPSLARDRWKSTKPLLSFP